MSEIKSASAAKRPPRQPRTGLTSTGARKAGSKSDRSRAREFALQGLYQSLVGRNAVDDIDTFTRDLAGFNKADSVHFDALLQGCVAEGAQLDALIVPLLDRPLAKEFGGTDGHKYVNAVLNGLAPSLRATEIAADRSPTKKPRA